MTNFASIFELSTQLRSTRCLLPLPTRVAVRLLGAITAVVEKLNTEYQRSALDTSKLDSKELKQAFDEVPECR